MKGYKFTSGKATALLEVTRDDDSVVILFLNSDLVLEPAINKVASSFRFDNESLLGRSLSQSMFKDQFCKIDRFKHVKDPSKLIEEQELDFSSAKFFVYEGEVFAVVKLHSDELLCFLYTEDGTFGCLPYEEEELIDEDEDVLEVWTEDEEEE